MPTTSNFGWTTPADTDLVKDGAAAIRTLGNGVDASLVDLKGGTTGQILSKASNTDLDYTWIANDQGDITEVQAGTGISVASGTGPIPVVTNTVATAYDSKGDLVVGTGADTFARLAVGTNDYVLTAASGETTGLKWAAAASGLTLINTTSFTGVASVSLPNDTFSATYKNYKIVLNHTNVTWDFMFFRMRAAGTDLTSSVYGRAVVLQDGSLTSNNQTAQSSGYLSYSQANLESASEINVYSPFDTVVTRASGLATFKRSSNGNAIAMLSSIIDNTTSYDSMTFFSSSGNIAGTLQVFGYKD